MKEMEKKAKSILKKGNILFSYRLVVGVVVVVVVRRRGGGGREYVYVVSWRKTNQIANQINPAGRVTAVICQPFFFEDLPFCCAEIP
jgi:hypothetical protein